MVISGVFLTIELRVASLDSLFIARVTTSCALDKSYELQIATRLTSYFCMRVGSYFSLLFLTSYYLLQELRVTFYMQVTSY